MRRLTAFTATAVVLVAGSFSSPVIAAEKEDDDMQARYKKFEEMLSGVKLIGNFTILGKDEKLPKEEYTISSVTKMDQGDLWMFKARIKYGGKDFTVPLPLSVKWADDTPMVTLTDFSFLGQGPFSARVLFYNGKYAGTWSHGKVGGHLFGKIVKIGDKDQQEEKKEE